MGKTNFLTPFLWLWLCFFCFAMVDCKNPKHSKTNIKPAFYHWKTQLNPTIAERRYLDSLGVKKIYVKFFDVDWEEASHQPVPLAAVEFDTSQLHGLEIVPTIFITNRSLLNLPMQQVDTLASLIFQKIKSLENYPAREIQFDCDWTAQTQAKYFTLLNSVKMLVSADSSLIPRPSSLAPHPSSLAPRPSSLDPHPSSLISATIRLHQFKYPEKTGVPPVDRGMLMCYNMGDLDDWDTENSILDLKTAKTYLPQAAKAYPLPLDFALPVFRWGALYRDGRLVKLLNDLSAADLQDTTRFHQTTGTRFEVKKSTYLNAYYLYAGDQLRLEGVTQDALLGLAALLRAQENDTSFTVAFYHLDSTATALFPKEKIREVFLRF